MLFIDFKKKYAALVLAAVLLLPSCSAVDENVSSVQSSTAVSQETLDYVFYTLSEKEKTVYSDMIEAVNTRENEFSFPDGFESDDMKKLFTLLYTQQERIFWLDSRFYCDDEQRKLYFMYRYDEEQTDRMRVALDLEVGKVLSGFNKADDDYEKLLAIHDAVVLSCDFSKDGAYASTAYGALTEGSAMCEGYAFAFSYLCTAAGIENYVVSGTNEEGEAHLWNKAVCDGKWYNIDCTWDDPILKNENPNYLRHDYFMVSDAEINGISHFPDTQYLPDIPCTDSNNNYFIRKNLCFDNYDEALEVLKSEIKTAAAGNGEAEIRFSSGEPYNDITEYLFEEEGLKEIIEELNGKDALKIKSAHYTLNDDLYVIHISLIFE